jgi:hypothetical protein
VLIKIGMIVLVGVLARCPKSFFRGSIFGIAYADGRPWAGVLVASVLCCDALSFRMQPYYIISRLVNCWLLVKTRTLAGSIATHVTGNLIACLGALILSVANFNIYSSGPR